ncbi:MAG: glycosyltransferase [Promethearchaeota archaeon]
MNIIRISTRIFPDKGGPAKQSYLLSKYCSKINIRAFNIACILSRKYYRDKKKVNQNFEIQYLPFKAPGVNANVLKHGLFFFKFMFYGILKMIKIIRREKIDLIHAHTPPPSGFIALIISKLFRIPYFYTLHGSQVPVNFLLDLDYKLCVKNAKKTFIVNRRLLNLIKKKYDFHNLEWFPNGIEISNKGDSKFKQEKSLIIKKIDLEKYCQKEDFIISYIGYMIFRHKVKGMIDFLEGFKKFIDKLPSAEERSKIKLLFIGDGEFSYLLKNKINQLKLDDQVFVLGERKDIKKVLLITDLLGLTSYIEGFPNVILEAMASNVPCLATNVGEVKHIIGETGYIVQPGDIVSIGQKLGNFYNLTETKRKKMGEKAFNRVRNLFDIKIIIKKLKDYYISVD